ncbi:hypothetical protein [uncultured Dysosmobacter sp.]|uniref:hypothetical protein n=1 Tax=uncultured Dysosmobacter sp. TaxID=2591384 RepID=UPI00261ECB27|nr:hypothetical protein [uncultured Dysosmobacter sp.]
MRFAYTEELRRYMQETGRRTIVVEVAKSDGDFEIVELHVHFTSDKQAELFKARRNFHAFSTELGEVLLPNYRLRYEDTVTFGLKKVLFWRRVTQTGIFL